MMYSSLPQSFFVGECFDAYRILGAHPAQGPHGEEGWLFTVWAPGATAVEICGGFDGWGPGVPMEKDDTCLLYTSHPQPGLLLPRSFGGL